MISCEITYPASHSRTSRNTLCNFRIFYLNYQIFTGFTFQSLLTQELQSHSSLLYLFHYIVQLFLHANSLFVINLDHIGKFGLLQYAPFIKRNRMPKNRVWNSSWCSWCFRSDLHLAKSRLFHSRLIFLVVTKWNHIYMTTLKVF